MITEKTIREAYLFLREKNNSTPDETLDFMLHASLEKLKKAEAEPELLEALKAVVQKLNISGNMSIAAKEYYREVVEKSEAAIKKATE